MAFPTLRGQSFALSSPAPWVQCLGPVGTSRTQAFMDDRNDQCLRLDAYLCLPETQTAVGNVGRAWFEGRYRPEIVLQNVRS
jgi:hypothetical protein